MIDEKQLLKEAGKRLASARARAGYASQDEFAAAVERSTPAIAKYEQGVREIPLWLLRWLADHHGIDANWIINNQGDMFVDPSKAPAPSVPVDPQLLRQLQRAARAAYKAAGHRLPDEDSIAVEAGNLYNALLKEVSDIRQARIVEAVIPVLIDDLKKRLGEAEAEPGTGKRSA